MITSECEHGEGDGCWRCCDTCDMGDHHCGGCGGYTTHTQGGTCDECREVYSQETVAGGSEEPRE